MVVKFGARVVKMGIFGERATSFSYVISLRLSAMQYITVTFPLANGATPLYPRSWSKVNTSTAGLCYTRTFAPAWRRWRKTTLFTPSARAVVSLLLAGVAVMSSLSRVFGDTTREFITSGYHNVPRSTFYSKTSLFKLGLTCGLL